MVCVVKPPAASRPPQAALQIACTFLLPARTIVVVGGATVVEDVELVVLVLGAVVDEGGASVEEDVVAAGADVVVAGGLEAVEAGGAVVGALVLEPLAEGTASRSALEPRLAAQAQPAVAPAPTSPANMARNRRRGMSGGLIGHK